jgi:hypothetical protein
MRCDPHDAAFARPEAVGIESQTGLTKREYFAAMAMQALTSRKVKQRDDVVAAMSVRMADALIAELNK